MDLDFNGDVASLDAELLQLPEAEKSWAMRLLSMAWLSLAAKMEEDTVSALSEFYVEGYYFESSVIQLMELLVLNTLGWKMGSITLFAFIHFFAKQVL